ncbi:MAG TPA: serine/threonine-protein kinase [Polyangia bacterium]|nr:serine/threonine-protein kinase [Polyangia bacterium]
MATPTDFIGKHVGRFTILSHLASGGMAELYIARQEAVGGFEKNLVVKMLQEKYAKNPRVLEMFLDEARLAAKLNHQNIVHVYDVDKTEDTHYIAMEYIHGETVTDIVRRSIARGEFLPLEHAVQIVADTAAGLDYAHSSRDADGRPTRIVHRDVSPSNILVTYEGITKIVDFGIARVQDQIREESGMRPGKVSYMSPEQVRGEIADHRADIYAMGIILYEITVGRRLWRGPPDVVMKRILEEQIPPPTYVRRGYPPALELIIMKALEKRPADRQQSAAELQRELLEFMEESGLKSGPRRLARYMKDLFADETTRSSPGLAAFPAPVVATPTDSGAASAPVEEDLDFDRRAPLMMRVEARPDDLAEFDSGAAAGHPSPIPPSPSTITRLATPRGKASPPPIPMGVARVLAPRPPAEPLLTNGPGTLPPASPNGSGADLPPASYAWRWWVAGLLLAAVGLMVFLAVK